MQRWIKADAIVKYSEAGPTAFQKPKMRTLIGANLTFRSPKIKIGR